MYKFNKNLFWPGIGLIVLILLATSMDLRAQASKVNLPSVDVPRAVQPPRMDASLDDPAWTHAGVIDELSLSAKVNGDLNPVCHAVPTRVSLLWDPQFLYVRFVCEDDEIYVPFGKEHDALHFKGDVAEIFLDPVGDSRQWYELQCNPKGGIFDKNFVMTQAPQSDANGCLIAQSNRQLFESVCYQMQDLRVATRIGDNQWLVEFAIPAKALLKRMEARTLSPMTMRANFMRYEHLLDSEGNRHFTAMNWSVVSWGRPHRSPQRMGYLKLIDK